MQQHHLKTFLQILGALFKIIHNLSMLFIVLFHHPQLFDVDYVLAKTTLHDNSKKEKDEDDEYAFMAMVDQCPHKKVR